MGRMRPDSYRALMMILVLPGIVILLSTLYTFRTSEAISAEYTPLVNAAMTLEIEVAHAHLHFVEALYNDDGARMSDVGGHLDNAQRTVTAMLEGGSGPLDDTILPLREAAMRQQIANVRQELLTLHTFMKERLSVSALWGKRRELDERFNRLIENVIRETDGVKKQMQRRLNRERSWQKLVQVITLSLTALLLVGMVFAFRRFERRERETRHELEQQATRDGLTGILNRRSFDSILENEWQHAIRARTPLSLILCDVDQFKRYNDTLGHQEGDACLCEVAEILQTGLHRPMDHLFRYGGEEFAIVLPFCDQDGAMRVMDRIHRLLEEDGLPHPASEVADRVTISAGIATIVPHGECVSMAELTAVADRELYRAKREGRNRTCASRVFAGDA